MEVDGSGHLDASFCQIYDGNVSFQNTFLSNLSAILLFLFAGLQLVRSFEVCFYCD